MLIGYIIRLFNVRACKWARIEKIGIAFKDFWVWGEQTDLLIDDQLTMLDFRHSGWAPPSLSWL